jgi:chromosome transmission fidelity protein 18
LLLARDADIVEKGKRGKHHFFGGSPLVASIAIVANYTHYKISRSKTEAIDSLDATDKVHAHAQGLDSSGPLAKRAKVDKLDIADKVTIGSRPYNNRNLS